MPDIEDLKDVGASYRRDLDAWVLYKNNSERIGQLDGYDSKDLVDVILACLRNPETATTITSLQSDLDAAREALRKIDEWCCPVLCVNCKANRNVARTTLANIEKES